MKEKYLLGLVVMGLVLVAAYQGAFDAYIPNLSGIFNINVNVAPTGDSGGGDTYIQEGDTIVESSRLPTALFINVNPAVIDVGDYAWGTLTSDGYNFAITTKAVHRGDDVASSIPGFAGADGRYEYVQEMNTPGFWEFQTTSENGVKSNVAYLEVQGMKILERNGKAFASRSIGDTTFVFQVMCSHVRQDVVVAMTKDDVSYTALGTVRTDAYGYGELTVAMPMTILGDWRVDVMTGDASDNSNLYVNCSWWVTLGR
jgi:hypothetical protein